MSDRFLQVDSDLTFSVTGPRGPVTGTVTASGQQIDIRTDDVAGLLTGLPRSRAGAATAANLLCGADLTVALHGSHGPVVSAGAAAHSLTGRLLTGSSHVQPGRPIALAGVAWGRLSSRSRLALALAAAVVVARAARR